MRFQVDTNLAGAVCGLPLAYMIEMYEPFEWWLARRVRRLRFEVAESIEAAAASLGLAGFESSLRRK